MYLAPLNYDRFFKKVFSKKRIAKAFLEDFLNIKIKKIEIFENKSFITDKAIPVEFDYRCKLDSGEQIIIEMQQWYKTDVIKRFYLYHSLSTSLQLETLDEKIISIDMETGKTIKDKLYNDLKPSITLIWMVDDNLGFKEDFVTFKMGIEDLEQFIKNEQIWSKSLEVILKERKRVLKLQNNETKGLDFLAENKLIFAFQKNIVKNLKKNKEINKYPRWFDFAKKTKSKKNKESDFENYKNDKLFIDIMNMLLKDRLTKEEIKYITKEEELKNNYIKYTSVIIDARRKAEEAQKEAENAQKEAENAQKEAENAQKEAENAKKNLEEVKKNAQKEKELIKKNAQKEKEDIVKSMLKNGLSIEQISKYSNIPEKEIVFIKNNL